MKKSLWIRRKAMIDTVNRGHHVHTVIELLAQEYNVSERCLWSDWERRSRWLPILIDIEKYAPFADMAEMKLNSVQKTAWRIVAESDNPNAKVGALKIIVDTLKTQSEIVDNKAILARLEELEGLAKKEVK